MMVLSRKQSQHHSLYQTSHRVHNFPARNSGAENSRANFMGAWHFWFFLLENLHAHKILRFWGGGCWGFLEGWGGSASFISMGAGIF